MGKIIAKNVIERKPGFLYYVDGKGNVCEAKMARGGKKKKKRGGDQKAQGDKSRVAEQTCTFEDVNEL